jgi:hypothetical protein
MFHSFNTGPTETVQREREKFLPTHLRNSFLLKKTQEEGFHACAWFLGLHFTYGMLTNSLPQSQFQFEGGQPFYSRRHFFFYFYSRLAG